MIASKFYYFPGRGEGGKSENAASSSGSEQKQQDINVSNPQKGNDWNNYQTRELSSNTKGNITEEEAREAFEENE